MYFLTGPRENLETMFILAASYAPANGLDVRGLCRAFARWLREQQPRVAGDAPDVALGQPAVDPEGARLLESGRTRLRDLDPMLDYLIGLAITAVFTTFGRRAPGSRSPWPGTMVIDPGPTWREWDVIEAYVTELTRTLLWLDEHRHGHRLDRTDLPPDSVVADFHDVVVAAEILALRDELLPPGAPPPFRGPPEAVAQPALAAAGVILRKPRGDWVLAPRARQLTALAVERIQDKFEPRALSHAG
jgi:hypothetical protein